MPILTQTSFDDIKKAFSPEACKNLPEDIQKSFGALEAAASRLGYLLKAEKNPELKDAFNYDEELGANSLKAVDAINDLSKNNYDKLTPEQKKVINENAPALIESAMFGQSLNAFSDYPEARDQALNYLNDFMAKHPEMNTFEGLKKNANNMIKAMIDASEEYQQLVEANPDIRNNPKELKEAMFKCIGDGMINHKLVDPVKSPEAEHAFYYHAAKALDEGAVKTLTDMFKSPGKGEFDALKCFQTGMIRDKQGNPYTMSTKPEVAIKKFMDDLNKGDPIYIVGLDENSSTEIRRNVDLVKGPANKTPIEQKPQEKLVNPKIKQQTLVELKKIQQDLSKIDESKASPELLEFKKKTTETIEKVQNTAFKQKFNSVLEEFGQAADKYVQAATPKKVNANRMRNINVATVAREVVNKAKKEIDPKVQLQDVMRRNIANKMVKAFQEKAMKSNDPKLVQRAKEMTENPKRFNMEVTNAMKAPGFVSLYGSQGQQVRESLLTSALTKDGKDLLKETNKETLKLDGQEVKKIVQARSNQRKQDRTPISKDQMADLTNSIAEMTKELQESGMGASPEYKEFMMDLEVMNTRLQRGSLPPDRAKQRLAKLADKANAYFGKKLGEGDLGRWETTRFSAAGRIMQMSDNLSNGKLATEGLGNSKQNDYHNAAAKIVYASLNAAMASGDLSMMNDAKKTLSDPKLMEKRIKEMQQTQEFKNLTKDGTKGILSASREKCLLMVQKEALNIQKQKEKERIAAEKQKQAEQEKRLKEEQKKLKEEQKKKEKEDKAKEKDKDQKAPKKETKEPKETPKEPEETPKEPEKKEQGPTLGAI